MGNTTIIELNHDLWNAIQENPDRFISEILEELGSGNGRKKPIVGGYIIMGFHRSGTIYQAWEKFKKKWTLDHQT